VSQSTSLEINENFREVDRRVLLLNRNVKKFSIRFLLLLSLLFAGAIRCASEEEVVVSESVDSGWSPNVIGASEAHLDSNVIIDTEVLKASGTVLGYADPFGTESEVTVVFNMEKDLGESGSITLTATVESEDFPVSLGSTVEVYPVLVSLSDGKNEWVNLSLDGSSGCRTKGFAICTSGVCLSNSDCKIESPSAFFTKGQWSSRQHNSSRKMSINVFPTCNWTEGKPVCEFNGTFFESKKMRTGFYTAKYILSARGFSTLPDKPTAKMKLIVTRKTDQKGQVDSKLKGAINLNVILVGSKNVDPIKTEKGKLNFTALFQHVYDHFNQTSTGIKLGKINVIDWTDDDLGSIYSDVETKNVGSMLDTAELMIGDQIPDGGVNIYFVSTLVNAGAAGITAAIGGSPVKGTASSGVLVATYEKLETYNPDCKSTCPTSDQEKSFVYVATTISHEIGHYLGLYHLSEASGALEDPLPDTPVCQPIGGKVSLSSCFLRPACLADCVGYNGVSVFCPTQFECGFNHVMWGASGTNVGDGMIFSTDSSRVLNFHPLVK